MSFYGKSRLTHNKVCPFGTVYLAINYTEILDCGETYKTRLQLYILNAKKPLLSSRTQEGSTKLWCYRSLYEVEAGRAHALLFWSQPSLGSHTFTSSSEIKHCKEESSFLHEALAAKSSQNYADPISSCVISPSSLCIMRQNAMMKALWMRKSGKNRDGNESGGGGMFCSHFSKPHRGNPSFGEWHIFRSGKVLFITSRMRRRGK